MFNKVLKLGKQGILFGFDDRNNDQARGLYSKMEYV